MFEPIADGVWTTARSQKFWGVETGTRMTIVKLPGDRLFVHCPVALDAETRAAVDALGEVAAVASSSLFHHLYAGEWMRAYPKALFAACPELPKKRPDLQFGHVLSDVPHDLWADELEQVYFSARFEKEVAFFHRRSRTMICADVMLNLWHHPKPSTRLVALLMGNLGPGRGWMERIAVRDWRQGRREVDRMLAWDIDRVVLCHGGLVMRDGRRVLADAYDWL